MFVDYREIKTIDKRQEKHLLQNCSRLKHKLITTIMLDAGLRVTEVVRLRWKHILFADSKILVQSLKKRGKQVYRTVPMTSRLLELVSDYYSDCSCDRNEDSYLFPAMTKNKSGHMTRQAVWAMMQRNTSGQIYPHMLRHTFASKIVNQGGEMLAAKELLGHASRATTEIYTHATTEAKRSAIELLEPKGLIAKINRKLKPVKKVYKIQNFSNYSNFHVGRKGEIRKLESLANRKINTIVLGPQGIGKSHLLSRITGDKVLRIDDMTSIKKTLGEALRQLHDGSKEKVIHALTGKAEIDKIISLSSIKRLTELMCNVTAINEYSLIIDDLSHITKQGVITLEHLKNHFHIVAAARKIPLSKSSFLTNFEKVRVEPLSRSECHSLIGHYSRSFYERIEDYELYKNHLFEQSVGNPLFIKELCERFSKEPLLDTFTVREVAHSEGIKEVDFSTFLVIGLSSLMVLRYVGGEMGDDQSGAFRLIGGIFFVVALFARNIFNFARRKMV